MQQRLALLILAPLPHMMCIQMRMDSATAKLENELCESSSTFGCLEHLAPGCVELDAIHSVSTTQRMQLVLKLYGAHMNCEQL